MTAPKYSPCWTVASTCTTARAAASTRCTWGPATCSSPTPAANTTRGPAAKRASWSWNAREATEGTDMRQPVTGFHRDENDDWVADLGCGHGQHVRHRPPFFNRPWTQTA